jgi:diguanylate cyclase (GGDEF)-like protein
MTLGMVGAALACWALIRGGNWRVSCDLMVFSFYLLAATGSYINGLLTTMVLIYPIVILLAATFHGDSRRWVVLIVCIVTHSILGALHDQSHLNLELASMVVATFSLTGIALLHWFATRQLKIALDQAHAVEEKLRSEIIERTEAETRLKFLSSHDAMTGLYNRFFFEAELERLQNSRLYPISVVMSDLDGLKRVNDYNGHAAGDELLKRTAKVLQESFRTEDVVARIGGDEFAVLLPQTDAGSMQAILVRLKANLEKCNLVCFDLTIELSVGTATAEKGSILSQVIKKADDAMYEEKWGKKVDAWKGLDLRSPDGQD